MLLQLLEKLILLFNVTGSEFVERYVGVGAKVRTLFEEARENPSIIFIDEIDTIGAEDIQKVTTKRSNAKSVLVEMDGLIKMTIL